MHARPILILSLTANVLLIAGWLLFHPQPENGLPAGESTEAVVQTEIRTNTYIRKQFFTWAELESEDYPTYIANLRNIGCPEETIRDIIIADVDDLFARRRVDEALPLAPQWWQKEPDPTLLREARRQHQRLDQEYNELLTQLLGPDWAVPIPPIPTVAVDVPLDGAAFISLSDETRASVQQLSAQVQRRYERILERGGADGPAPAALASLEEDLRTALSTLLTPAQLEEFLYRYSPSSHQLGKQLASVPLFNVTDIELRTLFRNLQDTDLKLMALVGDAPAVQIRRRALMRDRDIAFRNALGPARYRELQRLQDPAFQQIAATAEEAGMGSAAELFHAIDQAGREAEADIRTNPALTPLQQEAAALDVQREQLDAVGVVLDEPTSSEPPPPPQRTYSFQAGDTIADLSRRTGIPVALLLRANPGLQPEGIPPGTEIIIPDQIPRFP